MPDHYEIRASYTRDTIVVYQAYREAIAKPALEQQKFVSPFSFQRMTWIKPSFLWLMERSQWGQKSDQEYTLAVHIARTAWEEALSQAVLTAYEPSVHANPQVWQDEFKTAIVHAQWDPERSIRGGKLDYRSIQIGISRHLIQEYAEKWIVKIEDYRPLVQKIYKLRLAGDYTNAKKHLPSERVYPVPPQIARRLGMPIK